MEAQAETIEFPDIGIRLKRGDVIRTNRNDERRQDMSLTLPADLEVFVGGDIQQSGAYALRLSRPDDLEAAWDREFDTWPEWFPTLRDAEAVAYVGGAESLIDRLEDHRDGEVRRTVLTRVCEIEELHTVWPTGSDPYGPAERRLARLLRRERPTWFVRQA